MTATDLGVGADGEDGRGAGAAGVVARDRPVVGGYQEQVAPRALQ